MKESAFNLKKLPIGIQNIGEILRKGYIYVDKTPFIYNLICKAEGKHYFLSRPRRFGKSLFLSTLKEVFKGNKELFKRCLICDSDYNWEKYPVLHFDFSRIEGESHQKLKLSLKDIIEDIGIEYNIPVTGSNNRTRISRLINKMAQNKQVVVLIDEYDNPIINNLQNPEVAEKNRALLKGFFETLKSLDECIKFTFITGVSKFSQVSIFSGLNNLKDITMDPNYAGITGYTEKELKSVFKSHIAAIAKERFVTEEEIIDELRFWYNGYRFSEVKLSVYNPFSTLNYMDQKKPKSYWYSSGTPTFLLKEIEKHSKSMVSIDGTKSTQEELMDSSTPEHIDIVALMYQTGYFTIQDYNPISKRYQLALPNEEVRSAFIHSLVKHFSPTAKLKSTESFIKALEERHLDFLFEQIEKGFSSFSYSVFTDVKERTYHGMLLAMFYGMGFDPLSECMTNTGRIDVVLETSNTIYIIEIKLNKSAIIALEQIHKKGYFKPYTHKNKEILLLGANFSSDSRNIGEWRGELLSESGDLIREILSSKKKPG